MTFVRRDVWSLGSEQQPWHPVLLGYARAVAAMQQLPLSEPTSWRYQAAIHGIAGALPPPGAPWNECQHATWYFLPWHRMYLYRFEQIVRSFLPADAGPDEWALPYWNYSDGAPGDALPPAFRVETMPDGSPNPLLVPERRAVVNAGKPVPDAVTDISAAMAEQVFTASGFGSPGFGGPRTGFAHQGPAFGALEAQPHGPVHVWVGGFGGLMSDPDTAALDPIFWLHHANIDRLWSTWLTDTGSNPSSRLWLARSFRLPDASGTRVRMRARDVLDTVADLDYTYDSLPAVAEVRERVAAMPRRRRPMMVGAAEAPVTVDRSGGSARVDASALPEPAAAAGGPEPRVYLNLADIEGETNPGIVYEVYLNLPDGAPSPVRADHRVGVASFFGIEQSTPAGAAASGQAAHGMRYSFDVTDLVNRLRSNPGWDPANLRVELRPVEGSGEEDGAAAAATRPIRIGTVSLYQG